MFEPYDDTTILSNEDEDELQILNFSYNGDDDFLTTNYSQESWDDSCKRLKINF